MRLDLLDLDGDDTVLGCAFERLDGCTVSCAGDVLFLGTGLLEEVYDCLNALLGELLVTLCGTSLLVSIAVDIELGVFLDDVLCEELEVSLFTSADGCGTAVEVDGERCSLRSLNSYELTLLVNIVLATCKLVAEVFVLFLQVGDLVLEVCILFLKLCYATGEVLVLLSGEGNGNNCRNNAGAALEAGLSKLVSNTPGNGERERNLAEGSLRSLISPNITFLIRNGKDAGVDDHVKFLIAKECILLGHCAETESPGRINLTLIDHCTETGTRISNPTPVTGFLITVDKSAQIKQVIKAEELRPLIETLVGETMPCNTETVLRSNPLTNISIKTEARHNKQRHSTFIAGVETRVYTNATADKPVVAESVGLIGTTHNVTVGVTICILLSETADGEQEACCCKNSKDFHTFHNRL